jgi:hypothetical protein
VAGAQQRRDLRFGLGQRNDQRMRAVGGEAVALVRRDVFGLPEQAARGQQRRECGDDLGLARGALAGGGGLCG